MILSATVFEHSFCSGLLACGNVIKGHADTRTDGSCVPVFCMHVVNRV